jgi:hypothetical protein
MKCPLLDKSTKFYLGFSRLIIQRCYQYRDTRVYRRGIRCLMNVEELEEEWGVAGGNQRTRRKPVPLPLYQPQIPYDVTWDRTGRAEMGRSRVLSDYYSLQLLNSPTISVYLIDTPFSWNALKTFGSVIFGEANAKVSQEVRLIVFM